VNAVQAWEEIAALSRPLQPYATDRRAVLERILQITEEARDVHASSPEMREVAQLAVTALSSPDMKALTTALARIYTTALNEAVRARPID
jgi:hypothetical protein